LNGYLAAGDEEHYSGLAALPFFLSLRAAIRAKVEAANLAHLAGDAFASSRDRARGYFDLAHSFLERSPARLVAVGGLSGTGKSALAAALAPGIGRAPGAVWLRSDVERKHLFDVEETMPLPKSAYGEAATRETYARLARKAVRALRAGHGAVVDAVHSHASEREATARLARDIGVEFTGLWLEAPLDERLRRVTGRVGDASDADASVASSQKAEPLAEAGWSVLDASGDGEATARAAMRRLGFVSARLRPTSRSVPP
jgi:predicted kinase